MYYDFKCSMCDHEQGTVFPMVDYDSKVMDDGRLKRIKCEKCRSLSLYRHIISSPGVMGGTSGYKSMERYQQENPGNTRRLEDKLAKKMEDRHRKRVLNQIDKQAGVRQPHNRHQGYGKDKQEEHLKLDD